VFGKGACRFPRGMKLNELVYICLVLVVLAPLSPRAGAAIRSADRRPYEPYVRYRHTGAVYRTGRHLEM
jgi:hypothetical protein